MTVQTIIERALRELNTYASGDNPEVAELADGLKAYNTMIRSLFGKEVGPRLYPVVATATQAVENGGLYRAGSIGVAFTLSATPKAGNRFGVAMTAASNPATISPNGWRIEGATLRTLTLMSDSASWFFREDIGDWILEADRTLSQESLFPKDMEEHEVFMLALRLADSYGVAPPPTVAALGQAGHQAFASRYARRPRALAAA